MSCVHSLMMTGVKAMYASQQYSPSWKVPKLVSLKVLRNVVLKANSEEGFEA